MEVKRFATDGKMIPEEDGNWVSINSYEDLKSEYDQLRERVRLLEEELDRIHDPHWRGL